MKNKILFIVALIGILAGVLVAGVFNRQEVPPKPVFNPASNPFDKGIYAVGIIESHLPNGQNINIYPEVQGRVSKIYVEEGQNVKQGDPLLMIDDSVQRATAEQQKALADSSLSALEELKARPRKEVLEVAQAQVETSQASLKNVSDQLSKQRKSYRLNRHSVSKDTLDNAINAVKVAEKNLLVAQKQYELTKAGAWIYEIKNQENQYNAFSKAANSSAALLEKYTIKAPADGIVLSIHANVGSFISTQGAYDTYTQNLSPVLVMGGNEDFLQVRCYVDEILIHKLPAPSQMKAQMSIRGTDIKIPLQFVRIRPYVSPKVELSSQRTERVDVRVLPIIFKFAIPSDFKVFPGQLIDVYIGTEETISRIPAKKAGT